MMKNIYKILIYASCLQMAWLFSACEQYETVPLNWDTEDIVLNPADSTEDSSIKRIFQACYLNLPTLHTRLSNSYLDAATDDGVPTLSNAGSGDLNNYRNGMLTPGNIANLDGNAWKRNYEGIRNVNLYLEKDMLFPVSTQYPLVLKTRWRAEARLLRAYYYFELMKRWGGVPMVGDQVLTMNDDCNIPRSSIQEVADYIMHEISPDSLGSCYNDLFPAHVGLTSAQQTEVGHVNRGVALALLSRLKLYLASPLYNLDDAGNVVEDTGKWREAADAAKKVMDLGVYSLFDGAPWKLFAMSNIEDFPNSEMIMLKQMGQNSTIEQKNSPAGFTKTTAEGRTSPSQNLVDAFLTLDGKPIFKDYNPVNGYDLDVYDPQNPYANRDPRLARTVFLNGSRWLKETIQTYDGGNHRKQLSGSNYTRSGYYLKKFLGNNDETESYTSCYHPYQIFRYAEILLNYSEAMNECERDNDAEIIFGLKALRKRAGIQPGADGRYGLPSTYTQEQMRRIIRNERRIELAFEEHRFWDIRRWKICAEGDGDAVMTKPVKGVRITKNPDETFSYSYVDVTPSKFDGSKMYWYPIPRTELYGNNKLEQNPGWGW